MVPHELAAIPFRQAVRLLETQERTDGRLRHADRADLTVDPDIDERTGPAGSD